MSEVETIYKGYKQEYMKENVEGWELEVLKWAQSSPSEYKTLVKLFEQEKHVIDRFELADILATLGDKRVIPFLCSLLEFVNRSLDPEGFLPLDAAFALIKVEDIRGALKIRELAQEERLPAHWFIEGLKGANNDMAKKLLKELIEENKRIAKAAETRDFNRD